MSDFKPLSESNLFELSTTGDLHHEDCRRLIRDLREARRLLVQLIGMVEAEDDVITYDSPSAIDARAYIKATKG